MKAKELFDKILEWEDKSHESFTDYFMHDNVSDQSWTFWLLGKGFIERANTIILEILSGNKCIDQELLYDIHCYPTIVFDDEGKYEYCGGEYSREEYDKDVSLWAEFLSSTPFYLKKTIEFLDKHNKNE